MRASNRFMVSDAVGLSWRLACAKPTYAAYADVEKLDDGKAQLYFPSAFVYIYSRKQYGFSIAIQITLRKT